MKAALGFAAAGCALGAVDAKVTKWGRDNNERQYKPAQETLGAMPQLLNAPRPMTTSPPQYVPRQLEKRASSDNTCAYVGGSADYPLYCDATAYCASNSLNLHVGCCPDTATTSCNVWTTCLGSAQRSLFTTDNGLTLWCGFSSYPHCITHVYKDTRGAATALSGYTLLGCAVAAGTDSVYYNPFIFSTTSSSTRRTTSTNTDTTPGLGNPTSSTSAKTTTTVTQTPSATSVPAATPVGAIAGGIVGGVAAISLIIFGIWFLIRQNKKHKDETPGPSPGGPPAPGYNNGPMGGTPATHMSQNSPPAGGYFGQQHQPEVAPVAGFAAVAPMHQRSSIAKPPYTPYDHSPGGAFGSSPSPPASPPLPQAPPYAGVQSTPSPPLPAERHYSYSSQQPGGGYGASSPNSYQQPGLSSQNAGYAGYQQQQQQDGGYQSRPDGDYHQDSYRQSQSTQGGYQPAPAPARDTYQPPPPQDNYQQDGYPQRSEGGYPSQQQQQQQQQSEGAYQPYSAPPPSQGAGGGGNPQPQSHGGYQQPQPPPSSYQPPQPVYQPYPTGGYPSGGHTIELPTARGDGEVRELQG